MDVDVYLRLERAPKSWLELGTYTAMFPRLLSGPITTYHAAITQVRCRKVTTKKIEMYIFSSILSSYFFILGDNPFCHISVRYWT